MDINNPFLFFVVFLSDTCNTKILFAMELWNYI